MVRSATIAILIICTLVPTFGCKTASKFSQSSGPISGVNPYTPVIVGTEAEILSESGIAQDQVGYLVYDSNTQKIVAEHNSQALFIPASVTKVMTSIAALKILGPQFRFKTRLAYVGKIHKGILTGDLYLKGGGDPFLNLAELMSLVQELKAKGLRKLTGHFYYDESFLTHQESIDPTRDPSASYNPGISALSCEFNQAPLTWESPSNEAVEAYSIPESLQLRLGISPGGDKANPWTFENGTWQLNTLAPKEGRQNIPLKNPAYSTAALFRFLAQLEGIALEDPINGSTPGNARVLTVLESHPLSDLVEKIMEYSNNLMAELVHLTAARSLLNHPTNLLESSDAIASWLRKTLPHVSWEGFHLENGSGLGSRNRISPAQMVEVLKLTRSIPGYHREFRSLLPISGRKGTLTHRMENPDLAMRVWAKTGSIGFVSTLAGFVYPKSSNTQLLFAVFINDPQARAKFDQYPDATPRELNERAKAWGKKTQEIHEKLLTRWVRDN